MFDQVMGNTHNTIRKPLNKMYANGETEIKHANIKKLCWTTEYVYTCIIVVNMHAYMYIYIPMYYIYSTSYICYI